MHDNLMLQYIGQWRDIQQIGVLCWISPPSFVWLIYLDYNLFLVKSILLLHLLHYYNMILLVGTSVI